MAICEKASSPVLANKSGDKSEDMLSTKATACLHEMIDRLEKEIATDLIPSTRHFRVNSDTPSETVGAPVRDSVSSRVVESIEYATDRLSRIYDEIVYLCSNMQ